MFYKLIGVIVAAGLLGACGSKPAQISAAAPDLKSDVTTSYVEMHWIEPDPNSPVALISDYRYAFGTQDSLLLAQAKRSATTIEIVQKKRVIESQPQKGDSLIMDDEGVIEVRESEEDVDEDIPVLKQGAETRGQVDAELSLLAGQPVEAGTIPSGIEVAPAEAEGSLADTGNDGTVTALDARGETLATVYFTLDSHALSDEAKNVLRMEVPKNARVKVEGYTCRLGDEDYNQQLSEKRARAVEGFLKSEGTRVVGVEGRGECCPKSNNLAENRRAEVKNTRKQD